MVSYGLNVDESVIANALTEVTKDTLGYSSQSIDFNPRVIFASFSDETFVNYSDYNRVFQKGNNKPLVFPDFGDTYPDGSGVGVGQGLKFNVGTLIIECNLQVSAIRVKPSCGLAVSVSSSLHDTNHFVGDTIASSDDGATSSELSFPISSTIVVLEHIGHLNLNEIELFTDSNTFTFSTFPILTNGNTLNYLVSENLKVTRKGGFQNERFGIYTADVGKTFEYTRVSYKDVYNLSLEQRYLEEATLYEHILKDANAIFPLVSAIERNCFKHQRMTQNSLHAINLNESQKLQNLQCNILCEFRDDKLLFDGIEAPQFVEIFANVKYIFSPSRIEINEVEVSEITLDDDESVIFKKHNVQIGILKGVKRLPVEIYELPTFLMNEYSLNEILDEVVSMSNSLSQLTSTKTPNVGNAVSHAVFIDEYGETLNCEQSIFLPGDVRTVSVYCTDSNVTTQILVDENLQYEIHVSEERSTMIDITLPFEPGLHSLKTNNGSNVLFRISEKSIIHAPVHPSYYTSGQLEQDVFSSSLLTFIAQLNNFDLVKNPTMVAKSITSLVSIEDTIFDEFCCTNALFCRRKAVDLKSPNTSFDNFDSTWDFCSEHPWLACLNVEKGCTVIHSSITFENFTFLWHPVNLSDVTIIQGKSCILLYNGRLVLIHSNNRFECDAEAIQILNWNHIAFTNNHFCINGTSVETVEHTETTSRVLMENSTVVGTSQSVNLKPLLTQNSTEIELQDFTKDRLNEGELFIQHIDYISSVHMTVVYVDTEVGVLTWSNTNTGTLPEQKFKLQASNIQTVTKSVSRIVELNLPFSISSISIQFTNCGFIKNICTYRSSIPDIIISSGARNRDNIIDFQIKSVLSTCTNQEQNTVKTEHYHQINTSSDGTFHWIHPSVTSSFYVTPPSLIMMSTSQSTPYSTSQSLLILFNRRIEVFLRDESILFTISGSDGSTTSIQAKFCTLLSSQISIPNVYLNLSSETNYTIHLARARLFQFEGHVPCLETTIAFSTV